MFLFNCLALIIVIICWLAPKACALQAREGEAGSEQESESESETQLGLSATPHKDRRAGEQLGGSNSAGATFKLD